MKQPKIFPLAATCVVAFVTAAGQLSAQSTTATASSTASWTSAGNGFTDAHYAPAETHLDHFTLPYLKARWVFTADSEVQGTPTVDGEDVFFSDEGGSVYRVDAQTGHVIWRSRLPEITGNTGSYSRVSPAFDREVVVVGDQASASLIALSRATGKLVWRTVLATNKGAIITNSPIIVGGQVYTGVSSNQEELAATTPGFVPDFRGSVVAVDLSTGRVRWQTYTVPAGYTGGSVWGSNFAVDVARSSIYLGVGNNYSVPAAVDACQKKATTPAAQDACLSPNDHIDSVLAVNLQTGAVRWSQRFTHADTWTVSCIPSKQPPATPCPVPSGLDTDFGSAPNLFTIERSGKSVDVVGAGQKSGAYYTMNRDTGAILWGTQVSPDGTRGGIEWGTATDGKRIYIPSANSHYVETTLIPSGEKTNGGFWSALDPATGQILWQTPTFALAPKPGSTRVVEPPPGALAEAEGAVSVANGIMYGEDAAGNFVFLDVATGKILKTIQSGGAGISAPAIAGGTLYWSSGYLSIGPTNDKVYALSVQGR